MPYFFEAGARCREKRARTWKILGVCVFRYPKNGEGSWSYFNRCATVCFRLDASSYYYPRSVHSPEARPVPESAAQSQQPPVENLMQLAPSGSCSRRSAPAPASRACHDLEACATVYSTAPLPADCGSFLFPKVRSSSSHLKVSIPMLTDTKQRNRSQRT